MPKTTPPTDRAECGSDRGPFDSDSIVLSAVGVNQDFQAGDAGGIGDGVGGKSGSGDGGGTIGKSED